jgi:hypothetical protein
MYSFICQWEFVWIFAENSIIYKISFESNLYFIHICSSPAPEPMLAFAINLSNGSMHYLCFTYSKSFLLKPQGIFFSTITYMYEFNGLILLMFHISNIINLFQILKILQLTLWNWFYNMYISLKLILNSTGLKSLKLNEFLSTSYHHKLFKSY